jgi:hypothetical protein
MFRTNDGSADASSDISTRRRRQGRGLGPFTSGHLTIIVVALVIAVAFPFAAFAVTGSNVFVTDATSGARAKVDSLGELQTKANATTVELKSGNAISLAGGNNTIVPSLDVSKQGQIRVTVGNSSLSASSVRIDLIHIENPGPNGSAIDGFDSFTVPIGGNVSRLYGAPGRTITVNAFPTNGQSGSAISFTIFGR